jgi:hypothetical protein
MSRRKTSISEAANRVGASAQHQKKGKSAEQFSHQSRISLETQFSTRTYTAINICLSGSLQRIT